MYWTLKSAVPDVKVEIDPENPYIKLSDDGHMILTKDGKELIYVIHDIGEVIVPEGVESIVGCAISCKHNVKRIHLPTTIKSIGSDGIRENRMLEALVIPEGVTKIGHQAICEDSGMTMLDLPSTVTEMDCDTIMEDMRLLKLVLRCPRLVKVEPIDKYWQEYIPWNTCHLAVPRFLIPEYRMHPYWGWFKHIDPLD